MYETPVFRAADVCLCRAERRRRIKRGERPSREGQERCWRRHGSCNNRKVSCSGRRQASEHHLATALTYVTSSHNNFTEPRGTMDDAQRAVPGSLSFLSWNGLPSDSLSAAGVAVRVDVRVIDLSFDCSFYFHGDLFQLSLIRSNGIQETPSNGNCFSTEHPNHLFLSK